jgi:hypothetical protein
MGSNDVDGTRDERGPSVEQQQSNTPEFSEGEIIQTFETLGLESQEQRDAILEQRHWVGEQRNSDVRYIVVLSNNSLPAPIVR